MRPSKQREEWIFEEVVRRYQSGDVSDGWRGTGINLIGHPFYERGQKFTLSKALRILSDVYNSPFVRGRAKPLIVRIRNIRTNEEINGAIFL